MKTKNYTLEDKAQALRMVDSGEKVYEVAKKLGINKTTLYAWTNKDGRREIQEAIAAVRGARSEAVQRADYVPTALPVERSNGRVEALERENAALKELLRTYLSK